MSKHADLVESLIQNCDVDTADKLMSTLEVVGKDGQLTVYTRKTLLDLLSSDRLIGG